jgi:hypothetical protein
MPGKTGFGVEIFWQQLSKIFRPKEMLTNHASFDFDSHYNPFRGIEVILELKRSNKRQKD